MASLRARTCNRGNRGVQLTDKLDDQVEKLGELAVLMVRGELGREEKKEGRRKGCCRCSYDG